MSPAIFLFILGAGFVPPGDVDLNRPNLSYQTGTAFEQELDKPLTATFKDSPVRNIVRQIGQSRKVSILLDRRIDPTRRLSFDFNRTKFRDALEQIAAETGGRLSLPGDTLLIGPPGPTSKLRTLIALRSGELQRMSLKLPRGRFARLGSRRTLRWNDLDRPTDILAEIGQRYGLQMDGLEQVPHDLWAGAALPNANAAEAFMLVLNQFDLTFEWTAEAGGVRIVPVPAEVSIERTYVPRGTTAEAAAGDWEQTFAGLQARPNGRRVLVSGTVEQHEEVAALLRPGRNRSPVKPTVSTSPLEQSYSRLKFARAPAISLIERLEKTGIRFEYDEEELAEAKINLKSPIGMDLKDVTAREIIAEFCRQVGLTFEVDGSTVTLAPR